MISARGRLLVVFALLTICSCGAPAVPSAAHGASGSRVEGDADADVQRLAATAVNDPRRPDLDLLVAVELERAALLARDPAARDGLRDRELAIYRRVLESPKWRRYARRDAAWLGYAAALRMRGREADAQRIFEQIAASKKPGHAGAAELALADGSVEAGDCHAALARYVAEESSSDATVAAYARYRAGWCHLELGDAAGAIPELVAAARARLPERAGGERLTREARSTLVRAVAALDPRRTASDARTTFAAAAPGDAALVTDMLADLARRTCTAGLVERCVTTYRELGAPPSCPPFAEVARAATSSAMADPSLVTSLVRSADAASRSLEPTCRARVAAMIGALAMAWHHAGDARHEAQTLDAAEALYAAYLRSPPDVHDPNVVYYAAELGYARDAFCATAPLYAEVVTRAPASARRDEAAYAHVKATMSCEHLDSLAALPRSEGDSPRAIPRSWQRVLDAMDLYLHHVTSAPDRDSIRYARALLLFAYDHLEDAAAGLRDLVADAPADIDVGGAATMLLDCDARTKSPRMADDLRAACALPAARDGDLARICAHR
ncbi:MAG TPA: hypothetical protein VHB21_25605 [Minicystis sp.]|nr:hypothetical protein [Minicystis sp.]